MCGNGSIRLKNIYGPGRDPVELLIHITSQGSLSFDTPMQEAAALLGIFCDSLGRAAEGRVSLPQAGPLLLILVKQRRLKGCGVRDSPPPNPQTRGGGCPIELSSGKKEVTTVPTAFSSSFLNAVH